MCNGAEILALTGEGLEWTPQYLWGTIQEIITEMIPKVANAGYKNHLCVCVESQRNGDSSSVCNIVLTDFQKLCNN